MALGQDIDGASRVVFDLLTQLGNDDTQIFSLVAVKRPPNRSQQIVVFHRSTGMLHQTTESLVFLRSEMYLFALLLDEAAIGIERDVTHNADHIWFSNRGLTTPDD